MRTLLMVLVLLVVSCGTSNSDPAVAPAATTTSATATEVSATEVTEAETAEPETPEPVSASESDELFPDVLNATATQAADGTWTINATLSSPYDSPERYADSWRVVGPDGSSTLR